jgi:hypothetical protein
MANETGTRGSAGRQKKTERRRACDARATAVAERAQRSLVREGHAECSDRAIAQSWELGSHHPVSELFAPSSGRCMSLGDPMALPRELGRRIYAGCLAELEADAPGAEHVAARDVLSRLVIQIGKAHEGLEADLADDGRINQHERHAAAFLRIATLAMRGYLAAERAAAPVDAAD